MDFITVLMMIELSAFTLAVLTSMLGKNFWQDGSWRITLSLALFGLAYVCISSLNSNLGSILLGISYVVFSCAFCASTSALHRFYRIPLHTGWLLLGPLCTTVLYIILREQHDLRTSCINAVLAAQNLWVMHILLRRGIYLLGRGELMHLLGVSIMTAGLLIHVISPQIFFPSYSSVNTSILPLLGFFVSLHCKAVGFVMMAHARVQLRLQHIADEDSLTGLPNRRSVMRALQQAHDSALCQGSSLAVLLMDIDHFKRVNDQCGHPIGDTVLTAMGQILRQQLRPMSVAGRYGGEEFIVVCPHTSPTEALQLARRLCDATRVELRATHVNGSWPVTISVGISNLSVTNAVRGDGGRTLLLQADQAMYQAKRAGRDQARVFDETTTNIEIDSV